MRQKLARIQGKEGGKRAVETMAKPEVQEQAPWELKQLKQ